MTMLIKKLMLYVAKIASWIFFMSKIFRHEVDAPGPKDTDINLPKQFYCSKIQSRGGIYKFSVGMKHDHLIPFALKRRWILERWFYQLLNYFGILTKESPYFEIAPINEFVIKNIIENESLRCKLLTLINTRNQSLFKLKWLFSVSGSLWVESSFTVFRFQSLLDEDMLRIADDLSHVLDDLKKIPVTQPQCLEPLNLIKVNGFVKGLFYCAFLELIWMLIADGVLFEASALSQDQLFKDAFNLTLFLIFIAVMFMLFAIRDTRTRVFALKYNTLKFISAVFFATCLILSGINSHADTNNKTLVAGTVASKHVSHSRKGGTSYHVAIQLSNPKITISYTTTSLIDYDRVEKGTSVYLYIYKGALGYTWWDNEFYTTISGLPRSSPANT